MMIAVLLLLFAAISPAAQAQNPLSAARNPSAVQQVMQGKRADASAAWWGFNAVDSTAALQAAFELKSQTHHHSVHGKALDSSASHVAK